MIDFSKSSNILIGSKNRIAGLVCYATNHDWQHRTGEKVKSPLLLP